MVCEWQAVLQIELLAVISDIRGCVMNCTCFRAYLKGRGKCGAFCGTDRNMRDEILDRLYRFFVVFDIAVERIDGLPRLHRDDAHFNACKFLLFCDFQYLGCDSWRCDGVGKFDEVRICKLCVRNSVYRYRCPWGGYGDTRG